MGAGRTVPVLTIDGPSGSGKGTVSQILAAELGWHYLDSGVLYRVLGLAAQNRGVDLDDAAGLCGLLAALDIEFEPRPDGSPARVILNGIDVSDVLRTEATGRLASRVAALGPVRQALLEKQHEFRRAPGVVADGRDMGTTVFPDAVLKVFLTASPAVRAQRRYKQLNEKGFGATLDSVLGEIHERDARDAGRAVSPLKPADDAWMLDTSAMSIAEVVRDIRHRLQERLAQ